MFNQEKEERIGLTVIVLRYVLVCNLEMRRKYMRKGAVRVSVRNIPVFQREYKQFAFGRVVCDENDGDDDDRRTKKRRDPSWRVGYYNIGEEVTCSGSFEVIL